MVKMIANWIKEFILSFLRKAVYNSEKRRLEKQINKQRKEIEKVDKYVTKQRNDFKFKLQQYRNGTNGDVRRTVDRMRELSREPASRDTADKESSEDANKVNKGK